MRAGGLALRLAHHPILHYTILYMHTILYYTILYYPILCTLYYAHYTPTLSPSVTAGLPGEGWRARPARSSALGWVGGRGAAAHLKQEGLAAVKGGLATVAKATVAEEDLAAQECCSLI